MNNEAGDDRALDDRVGNNGAVDDRVVNNAAVDDRVVNNAVVDPQSAEFLDELVRQRLLAIIRGTDPSAAVQAALVLIESGIRFLEVSLVTTDALRVIAEVAGQAPEGCQIGAGTVLTREDVARAQEAGARFMVTPAVTESVAESVSRGIPVLAGALTPTEVVTAMGMGATAVKLFPSATGGPAYLRALRDPLPRVPFVPVGGVNTALAAEYFAAGAAAVGIGSPLVGDAVRGGDLDALRARAAKFLAVAEAARAPR
ncbi:MAG TPA: bifunctional 4-hydroxy-2-oxoglutarate aldolase/2-dehydro-3-deoxy-phosphogluconate aldolase [Dermatophilaceae bacterium]|nr:bifunctional 4-hydroxy-2-oxoglutarate aldolase/2-dehydro-3-deoxy-phosphogluconate aldolase [Dermatophilaceae bacterium]